MYCPRYSHLNTKVATIGVKCLKAFVIACLTLDHPQVLYDKDQIFDYILKVITKS
jgi:hypothetical protein